MQDIEFTIQQGKLWMLQTRVGKRNGSAAIRMAVEMRHEGMIDKETALSRVKPEQLDELLHPMLNTESEKKATLLAKGLPAGPGGATGRVVFTADDAEEWHNRGEKVILIRDETSPEDVHGMHAAEAILTAKGGMTSHAALVARGWGKCCIVGCSALQINTQDREVKIGDTKLEEGDWITMNGTSGNIYNDQLDLIPADPDTHPEYKELMVWADETRKMKIRTNAESPEDAAQAIKFGAEGIGLCRTEHMFFDEERILSVREMILSKTKDDRLSAISKLLPHQKKDFIDIFKIMNGLPVTVRLLAPPLHEFLPRTDKEIGEVASSLNIPIKELKVRITELHEQNPMLGHRGCRLGISFPEIYEMQCRAIFEALVQCKKQKVKSIIPEIMIPLVSTEAEIKIMKDLVIRTAKQVESEKKIKLNFLVGTMIELPRAAIKANDIAKHAEFFSFGTNDLTQTTFGISRDDSGKFLNDYIENKIFDIDPFVSIDEGVGDLIEIASEKGRMQNKKIKLGICGEHGGDPKSIELCAKIGLNYVSCSPYRVPVARLAAAQAQLKK